MHATAMTHQRFLSPIRGGISGALRARYHMNAAYDFLYHARHTNEPCVIVLYDEPHTYTRHRLDTLP
jgi:hypothetical protein